MAVAHYLEALAWQREVVQIHTIFGGKNPHPNFLVGGAPSPISVGSGATAATALNMEGLNTIKTVIGRMQEFVDQVYLPDTLAIASFYKDWFARGEGVGNFMTYGDFPEKGMDDPASWLIPSGAILNRDLSTIHPVDMNNPDEIQEFVAHSYYDYSGGKEEGLHPYTGETKLHYTGPKPPYEQLDVDQSYSWLKSPRWKGHVMEVGPLARVLMLYAKGHKPTQELAGYALKKLDLPLTAMFSTLGRTAARTLECKIIADQMLTWFDQSARQHQGRRSFRAQSKRNGIPRPGRPKPRASASWKRRAARWPIGSSSRTPRSTIIRPWCRRPGMPARAIPKASPAPTRPR